MFITFPNVLVVDELRAKNPIRQIGEPGLRREGTLMTFPHGNSRGFLFQPTGGGEEVLIIPRTKQIPDEHRRIVQATVNAAASSADLSNGLWLRHPLLNHRPGTVGHKREIQQVLESWVGAFSYIQEDPSRNISGLRGPQIGAVHRVHAHWSVSDAPAIIVMPTGTGKTETMLAILVSAGCPKLLVIVPTDTLRTQLAYKFLMLGILKAPDCAVLRPGAKHPIVCTLQHIPRTVEEVDDIFGRSQVIVTTSSIAGQCDRTVQDHMAQHCPYLFIDEAHHAEAPTWSAFKEAQ
jgi:Type III restriction enzyme, res subunit